jgi:hypothetical protein
MNNSEFPVRYYKQRLDYYLMLPFAQLDFVKESSCNYI